MKKNDNRRNWTRDEVILALGLYFQTPFGKISDKNPHICDIAKILGRTPAALSMKMCNLGRLDPTLYSRGVSGLPNGSRVDEEVWREFEGRPNELSVEYLRVVNLLRGVDAKVVTKNGCSVNIEFFKQSVLTAYDNTCCITGINDERLLSAYHIKPIANCTNANEKMNPQNGVCLSALHGDAFQKGLITIDESFRVILSPSLKDHLTSAAYDDFFKKYDNAMIRVPKRSRPGVEFIHFHNECIFVE